MTHARRISTPRSLLLSLLGLLHLSVIAFAGATTWRSALYPENWTPPNDSVPFTTAKLIQDFSYAGYMRGEQAIPEITGPVFDATTFGADPTGASDSTSAIQNAINAAAAAGGGVVFLPAGEFRVAPQGNNNFALRISTSNIVLRGAGTASTFLLNTSYEMRSKSVIRVAPPSTSLGTTRSITADLPGPTRRIPVQNAGSFSPGDVVRLQWQFTNAWINENNQQTWWNNTNGRPANPTYLREVIATNSAEGWIEIDIPTRYAMNTRDSAAVRTISGHLTNVGIESLSIGNLQHPGNGWGENDYSDSSKAAHDTHASWLIRYQNVMDSWISNVHSRRATTNTSTCHMLSNGVLLLGSFRVTLENCAMRRSQYGGGGGNGYMYRIQNSDENLIKDCIADFSRHGFVLSHAGTSGNVFLRCEDRETARSTGSSGGYTTNGAGSDHHMHFCHSNLFDMCHAHNSFYTAHHRQFFGGTPHGLTSAHGVYWNTSGSGSRYADIVRSEQLHYGYVIGTSGSQNGATNPTGGNTAPADHLEGIGIGATMEVPSLHADQLAKRMQGILVEAGGNGITSPATAYPLTGSFYSYSSAPVTSLWSQLSGPALATFANPSSPATTVTFPEMGTYLLEFAATDGSKNASAQVVVEVLFSSPKSVAHFIRGQSQNTSANPLGYFTSTSDVTGTSGSSGSRDDRNVVLGYTLPTLPVGTALESATFGFEITQGRDSTGAANIPALDVYLLDTENPAGSGIEFFHHGPLDPSQKAKHAGTTSAPVTATLDNNFPAGAQVRFLTLTGEALALLQAYYNGNMPTRSTVYFRFNLSETPSMSDFRRYRINTDANASALFFKLNAAPSVSAGPNQAVTMGEPSPWTPAQIATAAWYDASEPGSLTIQSGNTVSAWLDQSGNGNYATQASPAVRPTIGTATIGGRQAVSFRVGDGNNKQFLSAPNHPTLNLDSSGGANVFAVMNYLGFVDSGSGLNAALSKGQLLNAQSTYGIRVGSDSSLAYQAGSNGQASTTNFSNQGILFAGTGNLTTNSAQIFVNGHLRNSLTPEGNFTSDNPNPLHIGRDSAGIRYADVDFGEILVVGGALTTDARHRMEAYLAHKWNMAGNLPADHPYKTATPLNFGAFATLNGSATDPENDPLTFTWSVVSGPGEVLFSNPSAPDLTANFSALGTYVLRLTVSDGFSTNSDEIIITVRTAFENWAGSLDVTFQGDANGDGVADGMAWLLGAGDPAENATDLLPTAIGINGALEANFTMLKQANRGDAELKLQYATDLDTWTTVSIPGKSGTHDGVDFIITPIGDVDHVKATVPASAAGTGSKLFIRLIGNPGTASL